MDARVFTDPLPPPGDRPEPPVRLRLADGLLKATQAALRDGSSGIRESTVLWAGRPIDGSTALVSHLLLPIFESRRDFLTIPKDERIKIAAYLRAEGLLAFGDLHTHPRRAFLSDPDRDRPFSQRDGFYAIVIPDFGTRPDGEGWRFYEARAGLWHEVEPARRIDGWPL
jgi:proteasome lid subunit RPN8/RPN11